MREARSRQSDRKGPRLGGSGGTSNRRYWQWFTLVGEENLQRAKLSLEYDTIMSNCQGTAGGSETSETGGLMIIQVAAG